MSKVYHIRDMSTEKAFDIMSGELSSANELWKLIRNESKGMDTRRRKILSYRKSDEWSGLSRQQKYKYVKANLDAMSDSGKMITKKIDNTMEIVMFVLHVGGTCKDLSDDLRGMVCADMDNMMNLLQSMLKRINSNLDIVNDCYRCLIGEYKN